MPLKYNRRLLVRFSDYDVLILFFLQLIQLLIKTRDLDPLQLIEHILLPLNRVRQRLKLNLLQILQIGQRLILGIIHFPVLLGALQIIHSSLLNPDILLLVFLNYNLFFSLLHDTDILRLLLHLLLNQLVLYFGHQVPLLPAPLPLGTGLSQPRVEIQPDIGFPLLFF